MHGLKEGPSLVTTPDGRSYEVWKTRDGRAVIEMHRIFNMGHGTPLQPNGIGGNGTAGPFLLDVGVSSSREILRHWGIDAGVADAVPAQGVVLKGAPVKRQKAKTRPTPPAPKDAVTIVIEKALRSAGLLK